MLSRISRSIVLVPLLALWLPGIALTWNYLAPRWAVGTRNDLFGTPMPKMEHFSPATFWSGAYQSQVGKAIPGILPFFSTIVRSNNELYYRLFSYSPLPWLLVGRREYLLGTEYVDEFCRRDAREFGKRVAHWVTELQEMQRELRKRGQVFVYLITPSKIAHMQDVLPFGYPCLAKHEDRVAILPLYREMLKQGGIRFVDGTAQLTQSFTQYGFEPFPRGGIHWTMLSAYPASQALIREINEALGDHVLQPFDIAVTPAPSPEGSDRDYAELLNVLWPPIDYPTARISSRFASPGECKRRVSIAAVGGSFTSQIGSLVMMSGCPPLFWSFSYMRLGVFSVHDNKWLDEETTSADYELLVSSEVVVLEENEEVMAKSHHGRLLYDHLMRSGRDRLNR
jgi:alginate O-acetyltransferase complex protein AlgJ